MNFAVSAEQVEFADSLRRLLDSADVPSIARAWAAGDAEPGRKLWARLAELGDDLLGTDAELASAWSKGFQFSLSGPIYAGTNEVQKNIVAERLLGLPRDPRP